MVTPGMRLADIGTDHGYIPIYLVQQGKIPSAIAMDINQGPLLRAEEHIREYGMEEQIQTRLSDGLTKLQVGETDAMTVAGMGGALVIKILKEGKVVAENMKELILQPQSELEKVRKYLLEQEYEIIEENMILEEGKYYPMMKVLPKGKPCEYLPEELEYGKWLLAGKNPVLKQFLEREVEIQQKILESLERQTSEKAKSRRTELIEKIKEIRRILEYYF